MGWMGWLIGEGKGKGGTNRYTDRQAIERSRDRDM
jgi:hypothetical protein